MIANARMYSIDAATGAHWRVLLEWVIARAGIDCDVIDYPPPLPLPSLWKRRDLGCAFMCGYPLMHAQPAPEVLAAVLPRRALLPSQPTYWTDLVVRADSPLLTVTDALGKKLAYTTEDSQSGYQAPRRFFASFARAADGSLFSALVGPLITPRNVARAVLAGDADIGSLDSYAHDLLRRHEPELAAGLRTVATTAPTPLPPLVAAAGTPRETLLRLRGALLAVAAAEELADAREALVIEGFTAVDRANYRVLIDAAHEADRLGYPRLA
ncbi:MAG TPA: PhnD/SsuA/transferrin family substrate-binding protein [Casimicrobiaceae bacterium]|nr:PhnD/SsuA/transferrin family substrate-binding protein [Casimicrobiaceae bacterium]